MSLYQNPRTRVDKMMYGMDTSFMSWRKFAGTPMLYDTVTFNGGTVIQWGTVPLPLTVGSTITTKDYLALTGRMFKYWRGSIKYLFYFCLPAFYSVRMRLRLQHNNTVADIGNVPNIIINVKGDTWFGITIPYTNFRPWYDKTAANTLTPHVYLDMVTAIVGAPSPTTAVLYTAIYRSGAEDTQWAVPCDPAGTPLDIVKQPDGQIYPA